MSILQMKNLSKSYGLKPIFRDINLVVNEQDHIGIVGQNGMGKSTLFKIICSQEEYDSGEIIFNQKMKIGILEQTPQLNEKATIYQCVEEALSQYKEAHQKLEILQSKNHLTSEEIKESETLQNFLTTHQAWHYEQQVEEIIHRLQIGEQNQIIENLSTGLKKRVALARLLIQQPDVLLLDEPTNHLDTESIRWLENWLKRFTGTILMITHDRYFLDHLMNRIIEVDQCQIFSHQGNYQEYLNAKSIRIEQEQNRKNKLQRLLTLEIEFLRKGVKARGTKPKYREQKAEEMRSQLEQTVDRKEIQMGAYQVQRANNIMLEAENLSLGYENKCLTKNLSFEIRQNSILGIIGPNGSGKSSLLKTIHQELKPLSGKLFKGKGVKVGFFHQDFLNLDFNESILKNIQMGGEYIELNEQKLRAETFIEFFLFDRKELSQKVCHLSGGEKARVSLAKLIAQGNNLILFDEPTNNLDLPTMQFLESFLLDFNGASIVVTHDRYFLDKIADQIIAFKNDNATLFKGNYAMYLEYQKENTSSVEKNEAKSVPVSPKKDIQRTNKVSNKEKYEFEKLEKEIVALEEKIKSTMNELNESYQGTNANQAKDISLQLNQMQNELTIKENRWAELADLF